MTQQFARYNARQNTMNGEMAQERHPHTHTHTNKKNEKKKKTPRKSNQITISESEQQTTPIIKYTDFLSKQSHFMYHWFGSLIFSVCRFDESYNQCHELSFIHEQLSERKVRRKFCFCNETQLFPFRNFLLNKTTTENKNELPVQWF